MLSRAESHRAMLFLSIPLPFHTGQGALPDVLYPGSSSSPALPGAEAQEPSNGRPG